MLIDCAAYINGVRQKPMEIEAISDFLDVPQPAGAFVWVALFEPTTEVLTKIDRKSVV